MKHTLSMAALLCAVAGTAASAAAQDIEWDNAAGGVWNDAANWNPMDVPNTTSEVARITLPGVYDVLIRSLSPNIGGLFITNPDALVGLGSGRDLFVRGPVATIDGTIVINDQGGTAAARLLLSSPALLLDGNGQIVLNDTSTTAIGRAQLGDLTGGQTTTIGPNLTVRGSGQINASIVNEGVVSADADGLPLSIAGSAKTNDALFGVDNNGVMVIGTPIIQGPTGRIEVADGTLILRNVIEGGRIDSRGGLFEVSGGSGRLRGVDLFEGDAEVENGRDLFVEDGLTLDGTLTINRDGGTPATRVLFTSSGTIDGNATIFLNDSSPTAIGRAQLGDLTGGLETTLGESAVVRGSGQLNATIVNNGTVRADVEDRWLSVQGSTKTNNNLFEVASNGTMLLNTTLDQSASGRIVVTDGTFILRNVVQGGQIDSRGGVFEVSGGTGRLRDVDRVQGGIEVESGRDLFIENGLTLDGGILINREGSTIATRLLMVGSATIDGQADIVLNDSSDTAIGRAQMSDLTGGQTTTLGPDAEVRGAGQVSASLVNNGTIRADADGRYLSLRGSAKTNNNLFDVTGNGRLLIGTPIDQSPSGRIVVTDGVVTLRNSVTGGHIDSRGGVFEIAGGSGTLEAIDTVQGDIQVENGRDLFLRGDMTLNGTVVVNREGSTFATRLLAATSGTIDGDGEVFLNDSLPTGVIGRAQLTRNSGGVVTTLGPAISLTGNGQLNGDLVIEGVLAPGKAGSAFGETGMFQALGSLAMAPSAVVQIQLGGRDAADFDRVFGSAAITVDGTLDASLVDGFTPDVCENFTIIAGSSVTGEFDSLVPPTAGSNQKWRLFYTGTSVELRNTCLPDIDGDCSLTIFDFLAFQNLFSTGSPEADFDGDGSLTIFDFLAFQNAFSTGC